MTKCIECGTELSGRQTKYCSRNCLRKNWAKNNTNKVKKSRQKWAKSHAEQETIRRRDKHHIQKASTNNRCNACGKLIDPRSNHCIHCTSGENAYNWKDEGNISYNGVHKWLREHHPMPKTCEKCGNQVKLELANISGDYKRDISDYKWLCKSCHKQMDNTKYMKKRRELWKKDVDSIIEKNPDLSSDELITKLKPIWSNYTSNIKYRLRAIHMLPEDR